MATSDKNSDGPGLHATRQMLDELDALMERMLSLPVSEPEAAPPPPPSAPPPPSKPLSKPLSAKLTMLQVPADDRFDRDFGESDFHRATAEAAVSTPPFTVPSTSDLTELPSLNAFRSVMAEVPAPYTPAPAPPPAPSIALPPLPPAQPVALTPLTNLVIPPAPAPSADSQLTDSAEPSDAYASWFIVPLLWGNRMFDRGTLFFGEGGAWMRSGVGRALIGATGLILLGSAFLLLLRDWMGWSW